jgi:thiol-disulfide isomerase/thioredoxin
MTELIEDNLQDYLSSNDKVIVQFGATWCGACKVIKPRFKKASESNKDIVFIYADAEKHSKSRSVGTIKTLPTFLGFVNGELVSTSTGSKMESLNKLIEEVKNA